MPSTASHSPVAHAPQTQVILTELPAVRFEGQLNLDLNEVTTNLVPYPRLHFLLASMTPLGAATTAAAASRQAGARSIDQVGPGWCGVTLGHHGACAW